MQSPMNVSMEWIASAVGTSTRLYAMFFLLASGLGMLVYATATAGWKSGLGLLLLISLLQLSLLTALRRLYLQVAQDSSVSDHVA